MPYKPISDYGLIGNMHSAAVVGMDGSIDWLCFPRFDSPSVFAAILDDGKGGRFRIAPSGEYRSEQRYVEHTNILCTAFETDSGRVEVHDLMPMKPGGGHDSDHELLRIVRGIEGEVEMSCVFDPRFDYARGRTKVRREPGGAVAEQEEARLALASPCELQAGDGGATGAFTIAAGDEHAFVLQWAVDAPPNPSGWQGRYDFTAKEWSNLVSEIGYEGRWHEDVARSVLALHLLVYQPSGSLIAAATTSLPEWIGGERNWDYRFCWIRDSAFILDVFARLGHTGESAEFMEWLLTFCESCGERLQPVYGVRFEEKLGELTLDHLEGYECSPPVRIGNAAAEQLQLDIFGEVILACSTFHRAGGEVKDRLWQTIVSFVNGVIGNWRRRDRGIWEVRGKMAHFVHSKVMCWLALDRAIELAQGLGRAEEVDLDHLRSVREEIHADVLEKGWNEEIQSFVQHYEADYTDAALLMMPMVGFLPADDPRMRSTVKRIREELETDGLLSRYPTDKTDDGLECDEGVFTMCAFWLIAYLISVDELEEAQELFENVLACGNHLGLFSEMVNPENGDSLGNFPQAFTHVALIHTARNLDEALSKRETAS